MNKISVHATPTDKKDGEDRGVAVVTRRRLRPKFTRPKTVFSDGTDAEPKRSQQFQAFLDSLDNVPWRERIRNRKRKASNYATIR